MNQLAVEPFSGPRPDAIERGDGNHECRACQHDQIGDVAAVERQLQNLLGVDERSDSRTPRLDQRGIRFDRDALLELANFQDGIDNRTAVDLQHDAGL